MNGRTAATTGASTTATAFTEVMSVATAEVSPAAKYSMSLK